MVHLVNKMLGERDRVIHEMVVPWKQGAVLSTCHIIPVLFPGDANLNMLRDQQAWTNGGCSPFH